MHNTKATQPAVHKQLVLPTHFGGRMTKLVEFKQVKDLNTKEEAAQPLMVNGLHTRAGWRHCEA